MHSHSCIFHLQLGIAFDFQGPGIEDDFGGGMVILLMTLISVISIGTAVGTGYTLYTKEFQDESEVDTEYRGSEMTSTDSGADAGNNANASAADASAAV